MLAPATGISVSSASVSTASLICWTNLLPSREKTQISQRWEKGTASSSGCLGMGDVIYSSNEEISKEIQVPNWIMTMSILDVVVSRTWTNRKTVFWKLLHPWKATLHWTKSHKIPMFNRTYIFIHRPFSFVILASYQKSKEHLFSTCSKCGFLISSFRNISSKVKG